MPTREERDERAEQLEKEEAKAKKLQEFWAGYDDLTVGGVLTAAVRGSDELRTQILEHERAKQGRQAIIQPLVNWNS